MMLAAVPACTSRDGGSRGPERFLPDRAAKALRALGTITIDGTARLDDSSVEVGGSIGYLPYRVDGKIAVVAGSLLAAPNYLRTKDRAWFERSLLPPSMPGSIGAIVAYHAAGKPRFIEVARPDAGLTAVMARPFDPAMVLDAIGAAKAPVVRLSGESSKGTSRFRASGESLARAQMQSVDIWVGSEGLPLRFRLTTTTRLRIDYTVERAAKALAVDAPDSAEIERSEGMPDAVEKYREVARGSAAGVEYKISTARARLGWSCWKVDSTPAFSTMDLVQPSGGVCVAGWLPTDVEEEQFAIPIDADAAAPYEMTGLLVPPGSKVWATTVDGRRNALDVDARGLALYSGGNAPAVAMLEASLPKGAEIVCGAGPVNGKADLGRLDAAALQDLADQPWNCLSRTDSEVLAGGGP